LTVDIPNVKIYIVTKIPQYTQAIETAREEMHKLLRKRAIVDSRLAKLRRSIRVLSQLSESTSDHKLGRKASTGLGLSSGPGITDAIRKLLKEGPLTTRELRHSLKYEGFDINAYASGLTIIHNTLKRLENQNEVYLEKGPNGTTAHLLPKDK
jgi:hypothetical protein